MANTLYTPQQAARSTLAAIRWLSTLPRLVRQDFSNEFVAGRGRTVDVELPITVGASRTYTAANRAARDAIVFDDLDQDTIAVTMGDQVYKAVRLPDDFATFTLRDLRQQVLVPQARSVVDGLAAPLVSVMEATDPSDTAGGEPAIDDVEYDEVNDRSNFRRVLIQARQVLDQRTVFGGMRVPRDGRVVVIGSNIEAAALSDPLLQKANESGTTETLRRAIIGEVMGFTVVADPTIDPDFGVAFHRDAFVHVTRPSRPPEGAAMSATVAQDGWALRWLMHYNPLQLEDQSVVDVFVGASSLVPEFAVSFSAATE